MENLILNKTLDFALGVIAFCEELEEKRKYVIARQLIRSGTSIGANVKEAQNGESEADFLHKMKIAMKEAEESEYWLILCREAKNYPFNPTLLDQIKEIQRILNSIITTTKKNISLKKKKKSATQ